MTAEYWEPWKPEVGQRVRVRLSVECRGGQKRSVGWVVSHLPIMHDRIGVVTVNQAGSSMPTTLTDQSHPYVVMLGETFDVRGDGKAYQPVACYAAIELEPVE